MTLVSSWLTSPRNSKENIDSEGANSHRVGKIRNFQPISRRTGISEKVQDGTKVSLLLMTNRKSHMRFQLVPKSSTLGDLELL